MKNRFKLLAVIIVAVIFTTSCERYDASDKITNTMELRQLVKTSTTKESSGGSYFLVVAGFSSSKTKVDLVKVFAEVDGMYRLIEMPLKDIRISIDNSLTKPNILIQYRSSSEYTVNELLSPHYYVGKTYILNCPEEYLPEKLLPIGL